MENGKLLNMRPSDTKEYIIEQFHMRKEQDQNYIYDLRLSPVFHTLKKELSIEEPPPKMKRIISLLDKIKIESL